MSSTFSREGPLFINLATDPRVGDAAFFAIPEGESVVSSEVVSSQWSESKTLLIAENGVQAPHVKISRLGSSVAVSPLREDALVYLNGHLITAPDVELQHNDRLIFGHRAAFRFCLCGGHQSHAMRSHDSKIVDWELCCHEFAAEMKLLRTEEEYAELEAKLQEAENEKETPKDPSSVVCLLSGGSSKQRVWNLPTHTGEMVSIGSGAEIPIASLRGKVILERKSDHYVLHSGSTKRKICNGSKFTVSDHTFCVFDASMAASATSCTVHPSPSDHYENGTVRNAMFELQFAVLQCFRYHAVATTTEDMFKKRLQMLESEAVLDSEHYGMPSVCKHAEFMTETLRLVHAPRPPMTEENPIETLYDALRQRSTTLNDAVEDRGLSEWQHQRLFTQEQLLGQQAVTISSLEHQLSQVSPPSLHQSTVSHTPRSPMTAVRDTVLTFSPVVAARILQVANAVARGNFTLCWKRYLATLTSLLDEVGNVHSIPEHFKGRVLMALVDVASAYEIGKKGSHFSNEDEQMVTKKAVAWKVAADQCIGSDKVTSRTPSARSVSPMERNSVGSSKVRQASPVGRKPVSSGIPTRNGSTSTSRPAASPVGRLPSPGIQSATTSARRPSPVTRPVSASVTRSSTTSAARTSSAARTQSPSARTQSPVAKRDVPLRTVPQRPISTQRVPRPTSTSRAPGPASTAGPSVGRISPSQRQPSPLQRQPSPSARPLHQSRPASTRPAQPLIRTASPRTTLAQQLLAKAGKPAFK